MINPNPDPNVYQSNTTQSKWSQPKAKQSNDIWWWGYVHEIPG